MAVLSYGQLSEAAIQEAFYWRILFLYFVLRGPGLLSVDALLRRLIRRKQESADVDSASTTVRVLQGA